MICELFNATIIGYLCPHFDVRLLTHSRFTLLQLFITHHPKEEKINIHRLCKQSVKRTSSEIFLWWLSGDHNVAEAEDDDDSWATDLLELI